MVEIWQKYRYLSRNIVYLLKYFSYFLLNILPDRPPRNLGAVSSLMVSMPPFGGRHEKGRLRGYAKLSLYEINPIAGTMINTHLRNSFTHRFNIPRITYSQSLNSCLNACTCTDILQAVDPLGEIFGFTNFDHGNIVAAWLHFVNKIVIEKMSKIIRSRTPEISRRF